MKKKIFFLKEQLLFLKENEGEKNVGKTTVYFFHFSAVFLKLHKRLLGYLLRFCVGNIIENFEHFTCTLFSFGIALFCQEII